MRSQRWRMVLAVLLLCACGHTEPFSPMSQRNDGPHQPGEPFQLTYNDLQDIGPSWLPDGSGIIYTWESSPAENRDRCLAILPSGGGTRLREICSITAGQVDSTEAYGPAAVSTSGRLAYRFAQSTPMRPVPNFSQLRVADITDPQDFEVVHTLPVVVDGLDVGGIEDLNWLDDRRLVYLAQSVTFIQVPQMPPDTVITGLAVAVVDLADSRRPVLVPGTDGATGVSLGDAPGTIMYTVAGDTRVYRQDLTTGATTIVHDFAALGVTRDLSLASDRLVVIVGGRIAQEDEGGTLIVVNLATGMESPLPAPSNHLFRNPAISPTGAVVVEGYTFTVVLSPIPGIPPDTIVDSRADLWVYQAP